MIAAVENALFARLAGQVGAAGAVYLHQIPEEEEQPAVVFEVALTPATEGTAALYTVEVRTAVYDGAHAANLTLAQTVRAALEDWMFGGAGVRLGPLSLVGAEPAFEDVWGEYRMTLTWRGPAILWTV